MAGPLSSQLQREWLHSLQSSGVSFLQVQSAFKGGCLHLAYSCEMTCQHKPTMGMVWPLPTLQVQLDIRTGHAQTVEKVLGWLDEEGGVQGTTVCDAGCGTGSLTVPLALRVSF